MTGSQAPTAERPAAQWPRVALRIGFGCVWMIDAVFKWLPGFRSTYADIVAAGSQGQPGWLHPWFTFWVDWQRPNLTFFTYLVAMIETMIALGLLLGFARKLTYVLALVFSLLVWGVAEGFGGPYASGSTDIGGAIMYAVLFAALLGFDYYQGPDPLTVDSYLEQRISWWHWIAETGHHHRYAHSHSGGTAAQRPTVSAPPAPRSGLV